jgi:tripartite ATP-independent transporter DctP family solute receptor
MRKLLAVTGLVLALCLLLGPLAATAGTTTLRWPHSQPTDHPYHKALTQIADSLKQKTDGRVQVQVYPAGQLGNDPAVLEGMAMGTIEMGIMGGALLSPWYPAISVFDANYVFRSLDHVYKFTDSPAAQEMFDGLRSRRGIRVLDTWYYGTRQLTTKHKAIKTPDDLRGMKIRVPNTPLTIANIRAMGANATPMAFSEVYMGLSQGVMDGQENPLPTIVGNKFFEVQKNLNLTQHSIQATFPLISERVFQALSAADRAAVQDAVKGMRAAYNKMLLDREAADLAFLKERGMSIVTPDLEAFQAKAAKEIPGQFESQWGKGLYEKIQQMK